MSEAEIIKQKVLVSNVTNNELHRWWYTSNVTRWIQPIIIFYLIIFVLLSCNNEQHEHLYCMLILISGLMFLVFNLFTISTYTNPVSGERWNISDFCMNEWNSKIDIRISIWYTATDDDYVVAAAAAVAAAATAVAVVNSGVIFTTRRRCWSLSHGSDCHCIIQGHSEFIVRTE